MKLSSIFKVLLARRPGGTMLPVGVPAPDFEAKTDRGETIRLSSLRGQKVVLWFYPKADTPGCTTEGCGFRDRSRDYQAKNVRIFGVSFDSPEENHRFAEKYGFDYPLLSDEDRTLAMRYGACDDVTAGYPRRITYVIDEQGKIAQAIDGVQPKSHPETLLASL